MIFFGHFLGFGFGATRAEPVGFVALEGGCANGGAFFVGAPIANAAGGAGDQALDAFVLRAQAHYPQAAAAHTKRAEAVAVDFGPRLQCIERGLPRDDGLRRVCE